jgi:hypothetical protein
LIKVSRASLIAACATACIVAGCGGSGGSGGGSALPQKQIAAGSQRHTMSIPCTPDSYGYCEVRTYYNVTLSHCPKGGDVVGYPAGEADYEVYDSTSDLGTFKQLFYGDCQNGGESSWDPGEPAVVFSDPNLR